MTIDEIRNGLLQKLQQVGQGFQQAQKNPVVKTITNTAARAIPMTQAISNNIPLQMHSLKFQK